MLSRLCRAIARAPRFEQDLKSVQESMERNLNTINDDGNYTKERVLRVIRSYYFLSSDSSKLQERKNWGRDTMVQESIHKLLPLVNQLEPDAINLLIINLGLLNVYNPSIWREIENQFVEISHKYLPTSSIVRVCESFRIARRKNQEVWAIINEKFLNEIYSAGQLEGQDAARTFKNLSIVKEGSPELIAKLKENIRGSLEQLNSRALFNVIEGLANSSTHDQEFENMIISFTIESISKVESPSYGNILYYVSRIGNHQMLDRIESLVLPHIEDESILQLSRAIYNYGSEGFLNNPQRKKFAETVSKYFNENKQAISKKFTNTSVFSVAEAKFIYVAFKLNTGFTDEDILTAYKNSDDSERTTQVVQAMRSEFEIYLKEKNLI